MNVSTTLTIDLLQPKILQSIHAKQNDRGSRYVSVFLYEGHDKFVIPNDAHATVRIKKPKGSALFYDADENNNSAIEIQDNKITFLLIEQALTDFGNALCEINLYTNDAQRLTSFYFTIEIEKSVIDDATIVSTDYFNILTEQIALAVNAAETAAHAPEPRNGTWWIWDAVSDDYVDTGQPTLETGPAGTIAVGTVETVPYGSSAAITNIGTDTNAVLNFEIPEGKPGDGGSGDVSSVNNIAPVDGNITLTAGDVGAISASDLENVITAAIAEAKRNQYDVGDIIYTDTPTNPSSRFAGTWVLWGSGRVPVCVDTTQPEFSTVEKTGGTKTHALTTNELPSHTHPVITNGFPGEQRMFDRNSVGGYNNGADQRYPIQGNGFASATAYNMMNSPYRLIASASGEGAEYSILPPYITCYIWKRTA